MTGKTLLATTALVFCVSTSFAAQEPEGSTAPLAAAAIDRLHGQGLIFSNLDKDRRNARFLAWFGYHAQGNASTILYQQSASSGFSTYAVTSWKNDSAYANAGSSSMAADDFAIPGTGTHTITSVHAPGTGGFLDYVNVVFFNKLKYDRKTGTTIAVVKANCDFMPFTETNGGDLTVDVSSCAAGKFRGGHDYAISIQGLSPGPPVWAWQTNRKQIGRQAFWYGRNQPMCSTQLTPIKTCFPDKGYGRDLAFAIYGK